MEFTSGRTDANMLANGNMTSNMERELTHSSMEKQRKEYGKMERGVIGFNEVIVIA